MASDKLLAEFEQTGEDLPCGDELEAFFYASSQTHFMKTKLSK